MEWGFPALGCVLLASAVLLRRRPLTALAVLLGGAVATIALEPMQATALQIVLVCATGLEICYMEDILAAIRVVAAVDAMIAPGRHASERTWESATPGFLRHVQREAVRPIQKAVHKIYDSL